MSEKTKNILLKFLEFIAAIIAGGLGGGAATML